LYRQTATREVAAELPVDTSRQDPKISVLRLILSFLTAAFLEVYDAKKPHSW
jgi:hypothetical protein